MGYSRNSSEAGRAREDALLRHIMDSGFNGVIVTDALAEDDPIVYVNPAFERITGYGKEEILGRNPRFLQDGDSDQPGLHELRDALMETGEVVGTEALLRWEHPERGLLAPDDFVALAEETGLIVPIGRWVLREACRQAKAWQEELAPGAVSTMNVNISARQFEDPDLVDGVRDALEASGLNPKVLVLEITEGTLMHDAPSTVSTLEDLKDLG